MSGRPSAAIEQSRTEPSRAEQSRAEPCRAEPSCVASAAVCFCPDHRRAPPADRFGVACGCSRAASDSEGSVQLARNSGPVLPGAPRSTYISGLDRAPATIWN